MLGMHLPNNYSLLIVFYVFSFSIIQVRICFSWRSLQYGSRVKMLFFSLDKKLLAMIIGTQIIWIGFDKMLSCIRQDKLIHPLYPHFFIWSTCPAFGFCSLVHPFGYLVTHYSQCSKHTKFFHIDLYCDACHMPVVIQKYTYFCRQHYSYNRYYPFNYHEVHIISGLGQYTILDIVVCQYFMFILSSFSILSFGSYVMLVSCNMRYWWSSTANVLVNIQKAMGFQESPQHCTGDNFWSFKDSRGRLWTPIPAWT